VVDGDLPGAPPLRTIFLDGHLSGERLDLLLGWASETDELDYKGDCDLSRGGDARTRLELVRDIVAIANSAGGYIVVGVTEDTTRRLRFHPRGFGRAGFRAFDASTVRTLLERYVDERVDFGLATVASLRYPRRTFGLIFVPPSQRAPLVFAHDGQYGDPTKNRSVTVFQAGDVVVRRNTSSIRANQADWRRLISDIRRRERDRWVEDVLGVRSLTERVDRLVAGLADGSVALGPPPLPEPDDATFLLGPDAFTERFSRVLGAENETLARQCLFRGVELVERALAQSVGRDVSDLATLRDNTLVPVFDPLLAAGWLLLRLDRMELLGELARALGGIYALVDRGGLGESSDEQVHFSRTLVWKLIVHRVYVLGALAVRYRRFGAVPILVRQYPNEERGRWAYFWIRHAIIALANERPRRVSMSLCVDALETLKTIPYVRGLFGSDDHAIEALCQFDFLQCVLALVDSSDMGSAYPTLRDLLQVPHRADRRGPRAGWREPFGVARCDRRNARCGDPRLGRPRRPHLRGVQRMEAR
jgi:hypothetical protein